RWPPMMGAADPQRALFYDISLETFVPADHPLRRIRPLIDDQAIRGACRDLYAPIGRPSIPPEQLLLALVGWPFRLTVPVLVGEVRTVAGRALRASDADNGHGCYVFPRPCEPCGGGGEKPASQTSWTFTLVWPGHPAGL